jgi:hypothetical protein
MMQPETVVAYDATRFGTPRHLVKRNGQHVASCGDPLQPAGFIRYADNYGPEDKDISEADCRDCLFARASELISGFTGKPVTVAESVSGDENADARIVSLLALIMKDTAWGPGVLLREHFPADLVRQAEQVDVA